MQLTGAAAAHIQLPGLSAGQCRSFPAAYEPVVMIETKRANSQEESGSASTGRFRDLTLAAR